MKSKYTYVEISLTKETEEEGSYGDDDVTYFDGEEPLLLNDDICRDDLQYKCGRPDDHELLLDGCDHRLEGRIGGGVLEHDEGELEHQHGHDDEDDGHGAHLDLDLAQAAEQRALGHG